jgi:hypothetical protein
METETGRSEGAGQFPGQTLNQLGKLMKAKIIIAFPAIAILLLCAAALSPSVKPLAPYEREQTKGNVRVVLLKIERATVFTSQNIREAEPDKSYPVPVIGITYLVEALGDEPFKHPNIYSTGEEISIGGRKISEFDAAFMPENLIPGDHGVTSSALGYGNRLGELPKSFDKKRSWVEELYVPSSQTGMIHLQLKVGFNDHPETFIFDNIPVN